MQSSTPLAVVDELPVPRHMRSPGDDGYRTPTIEDAERTLSILGVGDSPGNNAREVHTSALEAALHRVSSRATENTANLEFNRCKEHAGSSITRRPTNASASTLSWKKRIRHVTWAYFTLTMATGGLANVLYEGESRFYLRMCPDAKSEQYLIVFEGWTLLGR